MMTLGCAFCKEPMERFHWKQEYHPQCRAKASKLVRVRAQRMLRIRKAGWKRGVRYCPVCETQFFQDRFTPPKVQMTKQFPLCPPCARELYAVAYMGSKGLGLSDRAYRFALKVKWLTE
jgi:hypothetical protein